MMTKSNYNAGNVKWNIVRIDGMDNLTQPVFTCEDEPCSDLHVPVNIHCSLDKSWDDTLAALAKSIENAQVDIVEATLNRDDRDYWVFHEGPQVFPETENRGYYGWVRAAICSVTKNWKLSRIQKVKPEERSNDTK